MSKKCSVLHKIFNKMPRFGFPFDSKKIPFNGIYVLFEKGENAHNADRIVRVGTHTGENQLLSRLFQHFINKNKDRSIFRKNIGRAILNRNRDPFLKEWELDLTTRKAKNKFLHILDKKKQQEIENEVSKYIQEKFTFVIFKLDNKEERLKLESKIISTISNCEECMPSESWLGNFSPKEKIRKSGLWLVNGLWKEELNDRDIEDLIQLLNLNNL